MIFYDGTDVFQLIRNNCTFINLSIGKNRVFFLGKFTIQPVECAISKQIKLAPYLTYSKPYANVISQSLTWYIKLIMIENK